MWGRIEKEKLGQEQTNVANNSFLHMFLFQEDNQKENERKCRGVDWYFE